jgi:hypothetical protein
MDGIIRHYINGTQVEEPVGWKDFEEELDRDVSERIIAVKYNTDLTFTGQGYDVLRGLYERDGFCSIITYQARQECGDSINTAAQGVIILADAEWNLTRCEVVVPVVDDALGAKIMNNLEVPVSPLANLSKNGISITAITPFNLIIRRTDVVGNYANTREVYQWFDAIQHAVAYISDGEVSVVSDWHSALGDDEQYCLVDGYMLRTFTNTPRRVSWTFKDLFFNMAGRYNLWMAAERDSNGNPRIRIEPEGYWYASAGQVQELDIQDLVRSIDLNRLYSRVEIGSEEHIFDVDPASEFTQSIPLEQQGPESYNFEGVCNTDATLDLKFDFVSDSNVMIDVLVNGADDYDEKIFIIQYSIPPLVANPITTEWVQSQLAKGYNPAIINGEILQRYYLSSAVGSNIAPPPVPSFDFTNTNGPGVTLGLGATSAWTALPISDFTAASVGYYLFQIFTPWNIIAQAPYRAGEGANFYVGIRIQGKVERFDSSNVLIDTEIRTAPVPYQWSAIVGGSYTGFFPIEYATILNAGDYIRVSYRFETDASYVYEGPGFGPENYSPSVTAVARSSSGWALIFSDAGGYVEGIGKPPVIVYKFDRHVDLSTWLSLTQNPRRAMAISHTPSVLDTGWVLNAKRNVATGECQWEVMCFPPQTNELP